jgi:peptide/nickel transport system permease protein
MGTFRRYIITRLYLAVPTVIGVSLLTFFIQQMTPGNPIVTALGLSPNLTPEQLAAARAKLGLDDPIFLRYLKYIERVFSGDFGNSIFYHLPVANLILQALPVTLILVLFAMVIGTTAGILLGALSVFGSKKIDGLVRLLSTVASCLPDFWLGLLLAFTFAFSLRLFPLSGFGGPQYIVLPGTALALGVAGVTARLSRSTLLDVINSDYFRAVIARGISSKILILKYSLRNAFLPVITLAGVQFGYLLTGAFFIESIYAIPGLGRLMVNAIINLDYPVVQGVIFVVVLLYVAANIVVDVTYAYLDPRIRYT